MANPLIVQGCIPLAQLESHVDRSIDIVGVVVDFRPPMSTRGTDWTMTFTICDKSCSALESGLAIRIFKPTIELLPQIRSNGDIILVRNASLRYFQDRLMAMSSWATSWIISYIPVYPNALGMISSNPSTIKPKAQELEHMKYLHTWWSTHTGAATSMSAPTSSYQTSQVVVERKQKFGLVRDMQFNCFYDILGVVVKTFPGMGNYTVYITDYSKNSMLHAHEWRGAGTTADGDDYDYTGRGRTGGRGWPGPWGQYTLQVTLWDVHAVSARQMLYEGAYVELRNVRAKKNPDGKLEGALHGDRRFPDRVDVHIVKNMDDPRVRQVIQRSKEYTRRFESEKLRYEEEMHVKIAETKQKEAEKQARKDEGNKNVRCRGPNRPITPISQILNPTDTTAPFVNRNYRIYCRVIDYLPKNLEDFSVPNISSGNQQEEDYDEEKVTKPWTWRFALLVEGDDGAAMRVIVEGEDGVHLLGVDAVDLRKDTHALQILREKLFVLWGSLEERTTQHRLRQKKNPHSVTTQPSNKNQTRKRNRRNRNRNRNSKRQKYDELGKNGDTDPDSDTDESADEDVNEDRNGEGQRGKMFEACVKEYGIPVGEGWKRMHRLFGVVIM